MKEDWEYIALSSVCKVQNGFAFDSKLFNDSKIGLPLIRIRDIKRGYTLTYTNETCSDDFFVENGDMLIGMDGDFNIGEWKGGHALLNQRVCKLIPSEKVLSKFIFYFIPEALQRINDKTAFSTVKHLSSKQVNAILLPNLPLSEQQSIVDYLDSAFVKIDAMKANAEKALNEAKALFQASLKEMLEPKEGWEEKPLKDIATDMYRGSGVKRDQVTDEGISCVRYGEIYTKYNYHFNECDSHTLVEYVNSPKYFEHGDILFAITGESVEEIGKSIAYTGNEKCIAGGDIVVMKHNDEPRYISYALSTPSAIKQKGHGKTKLKVVHTNIPSLKEIVIPIAPKDEQIMIADTLDSLKSKIDRLQENYEKISQECDALKQAILRQVFE